MTLTVKFVEEQRGVTITRDGVDGAEAYSLLVRADEVETVAADLLYPLTENNDITIHPTPLGGEDGWRESLHVFRNKQWLDAQKRFNKQGVEQHAFDLREAAGEAVENGVVDRDTMNAVLEALSLPLLPFEFRCRLFAPNGDTLLDVTVKADSEAEAHDVFLENISLEVEFSADFSHDGEYDSGTSTETYASFDEYGLYVEVEEV